MGILGGVFHQSCIHRIAFLLDAPSLRVPCGQRSRARLCETRAAKLIGRTPIYLAFIFLFLSPPLPHYPFYSFFFFFVILGSLGQLTAEETFSVDLHVMHCYMLVSY